VAVVVLLASATAGATSLPEVGARVADADAPITLLGTAVHPVSGVYVTTGTDEAFSTPAIADVTGDGVAEMVVASLDGSLEAYELPGRRLRWRTSVGKSAIETSPVVRDLDGDGRIEIVVGTMDGRVLVVEGATGRIARVLTQLDPLHCPLGIDCRPDGFFATPAVADVNGDGVLDIIAPSWDHTVYAWSSTGRLLWRTYLEDTLWSSPTVADIDRDGRPEIILGGDIWAGNPLGAPEGGLVWILRHDGSIYPGYPRTVPFQTVWSSPAVADINRDGELDVVVGTGTHFPNPGGWWADAFTARTGQSLPGWPVAVDGRVMSSPALGDLDGDPGLEVAFTSEGGWVYAYDSSGRRMWRACDADAPGGCRPGYETHGSVSIADVDDDGAQEVVSGLDRYLRIHSGNDGRVEAAVPLTSNLALTPASAPVVAEVGGRVLIAQASFFQQATRVDVFTTNRRLCRADWPTFRHDSARTGRDRRIPGATTPFSCPADFLDRQYRDFLGRGIDAGGTTYWGQRLAQGVAGTTVIRSLLGSPEFARAVAPVVRVNFGLYGTYPGAAASVRAGAAALRGGASVAALADERIRNDPGLAGMGDEQFVTRVFRNLFGRAPTAGEVARDLGRLHSGTTRGRLVTDYSEGSGASRLRAEVDVTMVYLGMLDRTPDLRGWSHWVPYARRSPLDALIGGFQRSPEYRRRVLP
jgi:hypothetical protein